MNRASGERKGILAQSLARRESEYSEIMPITMFCGTWNVNGKRPPPSLAEWLVNEDQPDIYAIGFQELDLTGGALLLGDTSRGTIWENSILETLNSSGSNYSLVHSKQLVGMLLCIIVKEVHLPHVSNYQSCVAGCGLLGKMGNKGGVGIRFQCYDTTICFVNSHLSAHKENFQRRNQDYQDICRRLIFTENKGESFYSIFRHDILVWLGDLNYRINMEDEVVRKLITENAYDTLLVHDQLKLQQEHNQAFEVFVEDKITFAPSYKYDSGTQNYDSSEKHRTPAWCDRVLWHEKTKLTPLWYGRHELLTSDHRPITAILKGYAKKIIEEKRKQIAHEIVKQLDRQENASIPQCELSQQVVDFGKVRYMSPITKTVQLRNTGTSEGAVVNFYMIPKPRSDSQEIGKSWLQISPEWGVLQPGESTNLNVTVYVESEAAAMNLGRDKISDIIIIRLENGVDHYLEVRGDYVISCMGHYLDYLIRQPEPIQTNAEALPSNSPHLLSIPKEIWRLVDALSKFPNYQDLFTEDGDLEEVQTIVDCLDTGAVFPERCSIHSIAETLLRLLASLAEPVIPFSLYQRVIDSSSYSQRKKILSSLKTVNYNVFYYLLAFLRDCVLRQNPSAERVSAVASMFADVLIRAPSSHRDADPSIRAKADEFMQQLLETRSLRVP